MKPKEYVKKYALDTSTVLPAGFIREFADEFVAGVTVLKDSGNFSYERFKTCVEQCKQKYDGICNKSSMPKDVFEKAWKYFYATTVVTLRDAIFGEYLEQKKAAHEAKKKEWREMHAWENNAFEDMLRATQEERMRQFFLLLLGGAPPVDSFSTLGLSVEADAEAVKSAYKRLALEHHPDKGGDGEVFKAVHMAKDKCLAWISR